MVVAERGAAGGVGGGVAELLAHRHAEGLDGLEAILLRDRREIGGARPEEVFFGPVFPLR